MRQGLRTLADLVERIEGGGVVVDDVSLTRDEGDELAAAVSLRFPADGPAAPVEETDGGQRTPLFGADAADLSTVTPTDGLATCADQAATVAPDFGPLSVRVGGAVAREMDHETAIASEVDEPPEDGAGSSSSDDSYTCRVEGCDETFETEHGMKIHATKAHQAADGSAPSPHRDPERLGEVYEACDTFEEMTEALDVDVTAQTVRRSMMSLGIHDPEDDAGSPLGSPGAADDGPPDVDERVDGPPEGGERVDGTTDVDEADGEDARVADVPSGAGDAGAPGDVDSTASDADESGASDDSTADGDDATEAVPPEVDEALPAAVDGAEFVRAVREAKTLYEVQRSLDMARGEVQNLLAEFDLLDLVHGRVATTAEREERKAEIERRILDGAESAEGADGDGADGVHVGAE